MQTYVVFLGSMGVLGIIMNYCYITYGDAAGASKKRRAIFMDTEKDGVLFVIKRLEVDTHWFFHQAFLYVEEPMEKWEIAWAVKKFHEQGEVPPCVIEFCDRIRADCQQLFYKH